MISYQMKLSDVELELLDDIKKLQYGTIYDLEVPDEEHIHNVNLSRQQKEFIEVIRDGNNYFNIVKVHQAEPAYAEVPGTTTRTGYRCVRLYKF
jgi:hypothetical protein